MSSSHLGWRTQSRLGQKEERKRERLNDGNNNGQATHGARKHAWRTQAAWANNMEKGALTRVLPH